MALSLIAGPANSGKIALLLDRYLAAVGADPLLIVPNRSDVDRVERELVERVGVVFGGSIGTFDDVFADIARGGGHARPVLGDAQRSLVLRGVVRDAPLDGLARSAGYGGFADELGRAIRELEQGLVAPAEVQAPLGSLHERYRRALERLGVWDRDGERRYAVERVRSELAAWAGRPVFAYGFEDLTGAEWALIEALAARGDVTVSLPYEPGRPAFSALAPTAEQLAALAAGRTDQLPARFADVAPPAIAHVERYLFSERTPPEPPASDGAVRFFEGAGTRGALELVAEEVLELVRAGTPPERIGIVVSALERWRAPLDTVFGAAAVPYGVEGSVPLSATPLGSALVALLRFAWWGGDRPLLFAFLRSPYSGLARSSVDFVEGRLRGRAIVAGDRVEEEAEALRGARVRALDDVRSAPTPLDAVRTLAASMLRAAHDPEAPRPTDAVAADLRAYEAVVRLTRELDGWQDVAGRLERDDVIRALEATIVPLAPPRSAGRVAVLDLMRARTRHFDVVFVLGLEEGTLPRRSAPSPFLDDSTRRAFGRRLARLDAVERDRYLFYTACSRPSRRLYLVREAANDEGSPREASPFWHEVSSLFAPDDVARWTRRRPLSALTWPLESAPTERERLRAVALLAADAEQREPARALARVNGWERRLERALGAWERPTRLRHPRVIAELASRSLFNVTELERFADCSAAWFLDRFVDPRTIDAEVDARLRGSVAHTALHRFFARLPKELGIDRPDAERLDAALSLMRTCLEEALGGQRIEMTPIERRSLLEGLWRDLEQLVREEAEASSPLVPARFEVAFGSERSVPELQRGLELDDGIVLSGKIDRIDLDPFSARGIVQDYKAGKSAHSAKDIDRELRLQIPLYMLVLRDLVGVEPLGGVYRPLAGARTARGLLREGARDDGVPGFVKADYLAEDDFWQQVERSRHTAVALANRIRTGDVRHDPRGGDCPSWCDLWSMCRVARA